MRLLPLANTQRALVHAARAQVPVASLTLPIATGRSALAVAGVSGGLAVAAQLGLVWLFRRARGRPWLSESPGFVAHQLIALAFMSICTALGGAAWLSPSAWAGDAGSRFLLADGTTRFLAAMLFGELVLWDLPCAIWIKPLRRPDSIIHHFAMAAVAFNAAWLAPVFQHGHLVITSLAAPQLGSCTFSGRAWRLWAARHSQSGSQLLGAQPRPQVLERAASKVADSTAF